MSKLKSSKKEKLKNLSLLFFLFLKHKKVSTVYSFQNIFIGVLQKNSLFIAFLTAVPKCLFIRKNVTQWKKKLLS